MNRAFLQHILNKHQETEAVPPTGEIAGWALKVIRLLYPQQSKDFFPSIDEIEGEFWNLGNELKFILNSTDGCKDCDNEQKIKKFQAAIPELYRVLNTDVQAILSGDPAAKNEYEVIRAYPGFYAISFYRLAHLLNDLE